MEDKKQMLFWLDVEMLDRLDRMAKDRGVTRSAFIRMLISDEWRRISVYGYELTKKIESQTDA